MAPSVPPAVVKNAAKLIKRHVLNPGFSWEKQRSRMDKAMASARPPKAVTMTSRTMAGIPVEELTPKDSPPKATVIHVHGGGFTVGSPASSRLWAAALSSALNLRVLSPDYSLAPEHQFPSGLTQVGAILHDVLEEVGPENVVLSGDSAGANLALVATLERARSHSSLPAALVLISPWLDLTVDRLDDPGLVRRDPLLNPEWLAACAVAYAPGQLDDVRVSPLLGSLDGLPPVLVQGGSDDILAPDATRFVNTASSMTTVSYSVGAGMWHDFALQVGMLAAADSAFTVTKEFVAEHLGLANE